MAKLFLFQAVNMFISAVKLVVSTWRSVGIDSLLEPASSGHSRNCSQWNPDLFECNDDIYLVIKGHLESKLNHLVPRQQHPLLVLRHLTRPVVIG